MNPIVVQSSHAAARADWRERTHVHPRSRQMRHGGCAHSMEVTMEARFHGFQSQGRICAIFGLLPFARCWAVSGAASANRTLTANQFLGAILRLPRSLSVLHHALQPAKQAPSGFTKYRPVLFRLLVAHERQRNRRDMSWVTSVVLRVTRCL